MENTKIPSPNLTLVRIFFSKTSYLFLQIALTVKKIVIPVPSMRLGKGQDKPCGFLGTGHESYHENGEGETKI